MVHFLKILVFLLGFLSGIILSSALKGKHGYVEL